MSEKLNKLYYVLTKSDEIWFYEPTKINPKYYDKELGNHYSGVLYKVNTHNWSYSCCSLVLFECSLKYTDTIDRLINKIDSKIFNLTHIQKFFKKVEKK